MRPSRNDSSVPDPTPPSEFMLALLNRAVEQIREALHQGHLNDAARIYQGNGNTLATQGALLSAYQSFLRELDAGEDQPEALDVAELAGVFVHRTWNRMRRKQYRDDQMAEQVWRAHAPGKNGELLPFDPVDPHERDDLVKKLRLEIAEVLGKRSARDRYLIGLKSAKHTGKEIVQKVRIAFPEQSLSEAGVSRVYHAFLDELRDHLREE